MNDRLARRRKRGREHARRKRERALAAKRMASTRCPKRFCATDTPPNPLVRVPAPRRARVCLTPVCETVLRWPAKKCEPCKAREAVAAFRRMQQLRGKAIQDGAAA